ncbi:MAG: ATP-dependent helicase [bacterium]|nr:ATP-dependent helicase [bacterium]
MARSKRPRSSSTDPPIDFDRELNAAQLEAVKALDGPHLVIAGAGTGKTRTLVYRVAYLVLQGIRPESILLMTFTRRAAREMLRRASRILDERCRRVAGGTYHGFAYQVLRRHAQRLGYGERFTILDRSDSGDLIGILRTEAGYERRGKRFPRKDTLLNLLSKQVNTNRSLEELLAADYPHFADYLEPITDLEKRYAERKKEQNVMDYDDLLVNLRRLLVEHVEVRRELSGIYRYVMVDEYQDTNRLQAHISALLASAHGNVMVVGDDAQSIYSFRGADFRNIMDFPQLFPECKTTLLEQNYRSCQPILDLGNAILDEAQEKYSKKLFTEVPGDEKPVFLRTLNDYDQAEFICLRILELREEGVPLSEIAVLSRASWHTNSLEVELQNRNIPFKKFGGIKFVETAHVKDVCSLLKVAVNPFDGAAWFRGLNLLEGIGPKTAQRISHAVIASGGELEVLAGAEYAKKKFGPDLAALGRLLQTAAEPQRGVVERLGLVVDQYAKWMPNKYDDFRRRIRDLEALQLIAERYDSVEDFLSDIAIEPPEFVRDRQGDDAEDEWVTLSTVHSAKGLEWHTVFIVNLNAGQFPSYNSLNDPGGLEEERRLLYVAVTRAKKNLYLIKPEQTAQRAYSYEVSELSPLLSELRRFDELTEEEIFVPEDEEGDGEELSGEAGSDELLGRIQDYFGDG